MPELPEVETIVRALRPLLEGKTVTAVRHYRSGLRHPFPSLLHLRGQPVIGVSRRSKYILLQFPAGDVLIHLGMTGYLHLDDSPLRKHDHWEMTFQDGLALRLEDPRRFGAVLWQEAGKPHETISRLGPEPLDNTFTGSVLKNKIGSRDSAIKGLIMDGSHVVGVGNIYATEALFLSKIHPATRASSLSAKKYDTLVKNIKYVLSEGIRLGGASIRDYRHVDGSEGSFATIINIYGKAGLPCPVCATTLQSQSIASRTSVWCPSCQKTSRPKSKDKLQNKI